MKSRRQFLQLSAAGAALLPFTRLLIPTLLGKARATAKNGGINKPVVVSTWDFGVAANEEAWKVLSAGGRALDAVEAGVRVPEADPKIPLPYSLLAPSRQRCCSSGWSHRCLRAQAGCWARTLIRNRQAMRPI